MTSEDFSHFSSMIPGYYLKLGVSNPEAVVRNIKRKICKKYSAEKIIRNYGIFSSSGTK